MQIRFAFLELPYRASVFGIVVRDQYTGQAREVYAHPKLSTDEATALAFEMLNDADIDALGEQDVTWERCFLDCESHAPALA